MKIYFPLLFSLKQNFRFRSVKLKINFLGRFLLVTIATVSINCI